jgi:DNA-directed RNA polymerase specialized sigma24 family protein
MLQKISKKHNLWLKMAYGICNNKDLANDLVQEMYLKVYSYNKDLNDFYIYYTIKHLFIESLKQDAKRIKAENNFNYLNKKETEEEKVDLNIPDCLTWVEQQILMHRYDKSCRDIEKQFNINFLKVYRIEKNAKQKIKEWEEKRKTKA